MFDPSLIIRKLSVSVDTLKYFTAIYIIDLLLILVRNKNGNNSKYIIHVDI